MAESIGSVAESTGVSESVNVMNATVLNGVSEGEKRGSVSKATRVFQIADDNDLFEVDRKADRIEVMKGMCNDRDIDKLDLSACRNLVEWVVEEKCFQFVMELKMSGFACLESVAIGNECFTKGMGVFEMSHCDGLKSVRIGKGSFVHWSGFVMKDCGVEEVEIGDGCFVDCEKAVFEDLARLRTLHLGNEVFKGDERKKNELVMQNLDELSELKGRMRALRNVKKVRLVNLPKLSVMVLRFAFVNVKELEMENASLLESHEVLGEVMRKKREEERRREEEERRREEEERKRQEEEERRKEMERQKRLAEEKKRRENGIVICLDDLEHLSPTLTSITIQSCKDYRSEVLDFSRFTELNELKIEGECFDYPSKVRIEGMKQLKRVEIGPGCFTSTNAFNELVVKDCPELSELVIGSNCFSSFTSFQLSGLPSLKRLSIGSYCFKEARFEVRKMESLETIQLGSSCFEKSLHTVIEDCPKLKSVNVKQNALRGVKSDQCDVVLKNCPVLEKVQCENHCFEYGRVRIENCPSLKKEGIGMEMKEGVKREKRRVRREWYGKNWKWVVSYVIPGLILAIVLYSISISFIVSKLQQSTVFHLKLCVSFSITENMTELVVPSNRCNSEKMNTLDLSLFPQLKSIVIGDDCFMNVGQLNLNGLSKLETVVIGINSFTR
ncbi:hypothetical protein WA577_000446, partial [Blastocystis sp. JDR]